MSPSSTVEVTVPDIGEFDEVEIVEVLVDAGDRVERDASLVTLESDKASMDIPAPQAGRVVALDIAVGDMVGEGTRILTLEVESDPSEGDGAEPAAEVSASEEAEPATETPDDSADEAPEETAGEAPEETAGETPEETAGETPEETADETAEGAPSSPRRPPPVAHPEGDSSATPPHASPSVRRFARELGVDLGRVSGSGRKGRILRDDVQAFTRKALAGGSKETAGGGIPPVPTVDFSRFGPVEEVPLGRIRRVAKNNLHRSWLNVPHVTQHDLADITELEEFRRGQRDEAARREVKLTPLPLVMKACAAALRAFPRVNSSLGADGESLVFKHYVHLGIAVDTSEGLMVPVVRDVDTKGLFELARELGEVGERARAGKMKLADLQGASFTISSLGSIGGSFFTPIVNAPEVAILGVGRAEIQPVWREGEFVPRQMLPLSLSYDHRVVDGAEAARFITHLSSLLGDIRQILL